MKLTTIIIVLLILLILFSSVNEGFILTDVLPSNLSITLTKGLQTINAKTGVEFTTDPNVLDGNTYYAVGTLNDAGKKAVADANLTIKNNGTTCDSFPNKLFIKLPETDAVCKTSDADLYDYAADSFEVCKPSMSEPNVLYKQGTLKTIDSSITLQDAYNGGKTCSQLLTNQTTKYIPCGDIDAVCKTSLFDLYDVPADSNNVCNILEGGVWKKQATLKSDAAITITPKYGNGKTCIQKYQNRLTTNITCNAISAVCPINDNTFYTFDTTATKGSSLIPPPAPSIASVTSNLASQPVTKDGPTSSFADFNATIKVNVPAIYSSFGVTTYKVNVIDTYNNRKVNFQDTFTIDSNNNLIVRVGHYRPTTNTYPGLYGIELSRARIKDEHDFDGRYSVTIAGIGQVGVGPNSVPFTFNSGSPTAAQMQELYDRDAAYLTSIGMSTND